MKLLRLVLAISLLLNAWLGYSIYQTEWRNRRALAYPAQLVAYRLTSLAQYADGVSESQWAELSTRTWVYDSVRQIVDFGFAAESIPVRGEPAEVAHKLGELGRRITDYQDDAHRLAFSSSPEARAKIQELARQIQDAGWGPPAGAGRPAGWSESQGWAVLNQALDRLID